MTKNAKAVLIRQITFRRNVSYLVLFVGLSVSTFANVMQSWDLGWIGWIIAALAPIALFGCLFLLELLGSDVQIVKRVLSYIVLGSVCLIAGYASYLHIYRLSYETTHDVRISALVPLMIDLPMILASVLLSEARKALTLTRVPTPRTRPVAATTAGAKTIPVRAPRQRATRETKIIPATA